MPWLWEAKESTTRVDGSIRTSKSTSRSYKNWRLSYAQQLPQTLGYVRTPHGKRFVRAATRNSLLNGERVPVRSAGSIDAQSAVGADASQQNARLASSNSLPWMSPTGRLSARTAGEVGTSSVLHHSTHGLTGHSEHRCSRGQRHTAAHHLSCRLPALHRLDGRTPAHASTGTRGL